MKKQEATIKLLNFFANTNNGYISQDILDNPNKYIHSFDEYLILNAFSGLYGYYDQVVRNQFCKLPNIDICKFLSLGGINEKQMTDFIILNSDIMINRPWISFSESTPQKRKHNIYNMFNYKIMKEVKTGNVLHSVEVDLSECFIDGLTEKQIKAYKDKKRIEPILDLQKIIKKFDLDKNAKLFDFMTMNNNALLLNKDFEPYFDFVKGKDNIWEVRIIKGK